MHDEFAMWDSSLVQALKKSTYTVYLCKRDLAYNSKGLFATAIWVAGCYGRR
jgi:hypothetical protein